MVMNTVEKIDALINKTKSLPIILEQLKSTQLKYERNTISFCEYDEEWTQSMRSLSKERRYIDILRDELTEYFIEEEDAQLKKSS